MLLLTRLSKTEGKITGYLLITVFNIIHCSHCIPDIFSLYSLRCKISGTNLLNFLLKDGVRLGLGVELAAQLAYTQRTREVCYRGETDKEYGPKMYDVVMDCLINTLRTNGHDHVWDNQIVQTALQNYLVWKAQDIITNPLSIAKTTHLAATKNAFDDAVAASAKGPMTSPANGAPRPMKKKKKFHSGNIKQLEADHHAEYLAKEAALAAALASAQHKFVLEQASYGPTSEDEYKEQINKYLQPTTDYTLSFFDGLDDYFSKFNTDKNGEGNETVGDLVEVLRLFKAMKVVNPAVAKGMSQVIAIEKLTFLFDNVPYLANHPDKQRWLTNLIATFAATKAKHASNMMTDRLVVGSICHVTCDTQQIPRVARVTSKGQDTFSVKFLGEIFNEDDSTEEDDVQAERVVPDIESFYRYFVDLGEGFEDWVNLVEVLVLLQPSSAAAERVFSQLSQMFTPQQMKLNQKWIFICIALRFNKR